MTREICRAEVLAVQVASDCADHAWPDVECCVPAAEDQASSRAQRIGQIKAVFVYKLIAAGSLEERILQLQSRKAELAKGILEGSLTSSTALTQNDLDQLLAPLG